MNEEKKDEGRRIRLSEKRNRRAMHHNKRYYSKTRKIKKIKKNKNKEMKTQRQK